MYFPYLRGKQFELLAIRELAPILDSDKIIPIIEPVKSNTASLKTALEVLQRNNVRCQLIINPSVGDFRSNNTGLDQFIGSLVVAGAPMRVHWRR